VPKGKLIARAHILLYWYTNWFVIINRVTSLADRLKIDFALIHTDCTRGSHQAVGTPVIEITDPSSSNNNDDDDVVYHTSNTTANLTTSIVNGKLADEDDDDDDDDSVVKEVLSVEEEHSSTITLVGDVAGKVVFIVVSC